MQCFVNADWVGSAYDRRSTSGYCIVHAGNLFLCKSKKQTIVARPSVEAEQRTMAKAVTKHVWMKQLLGELGFQRHRP